MHDLIQSSKFNSTILESSETCLEVESLQISLMAISGSLDPSRIPKLSQVWIFSQNYLLCMVSLVENSFLKDFWYFAYNSFNFQYSISNRIEDLILVSSC